jgi:hypothetical protein
MANSLITPDMITKYALVEFKNAMVMMKTVDRQLDGQFNEVGDTISVRRRVRFEATSTATITNAYNDVTEGKIAVQLDKRKVVPFRFSSKELTLDIGNFNERYIRPAMIELVQKVESDIATVAKNNLFWYAGTPGTTPSTYANIAACRTKLNNAGVPMDTERYLFLEPEAAGVVAGTQLAVGSSTAGHGAAGNIDRGRADQMFNEAYIGKMAGFHILESQSLARHTTGTYDTPTSTALVAGTQSTTYAISKDGYTMSLNIDGVTSGSFAMKKGDSFTIAGVYAVNPRTRTSTGQLQNFTLTADVAAAGAAGTQTWTITPPIIASGAYQTTEQAAPNNAVITVKGTSATQYPRNLFWHKDAITLAMSPLDLPTGATVKSRAEMDGTSIRLVSDYNVDTDLQSWRFDILYAVVAQNPGMGGQLTG